MDAQPAKSSEKTIADFLKSGGILTAALLIGIVLYGWLTSNLFLSVAGVIAQYGEGELAAKINTFLFIFVYGSFMSFIRYRSSVSVHKFARLALKLLHLALIAGLSLVVIVICMPTSM